jgi:hypothetical protein
MEDDLYAFGEKDAGDLIRKLRPKDDGRADLPSQSQDASQCFVGVSSGTITAKAGSVLGSGTVAVKYIDNADTLQTLWDVTAKNPGSEIASGRTVIIWRVGNKWIAVEVCP